MQKLAGRFVASPSALFSIDSIEADAKILLGDALKFFLVADKKSFNYTGMSFAHTPNHILDMVALRAAVENEMIT